MRASWGGGILPQSRASRACRRAHRDATMRGAGGLELPPTTARPSFVVRFPFAIPALFIGATLVAAVIGLVRHNLGWWSVGMNSVGLQGMGPLGRWFTRRRGRPASVREQVSDNYKGLAIVFPFTFAVTIGFMLLFPTWFPSSCPLPPRH